MLNMSKPALNADAMDFIEEMATLLAPWGMPRAAGRVYGYLLISDAPATLDQIAADLTISKSGAFAATQTLERFGNAQRYGEPGTKRVRYGPPTDFATPFARHNALFGAISRLARATPDAGTSAVATGRLAEMAGFYEAVHEALAATIAQFHAARRPHTRP